MYNGIVCVTFNDLLSTDGGEAVMKIGTLKSMISRNKELCITKSKGQTNYARIDYYALPEKWRARFEANTAIRASCSRSPESRTGSEW